MKPGLNIIWKVIFLISILIIIAGPAWPDTSAPLEESEFPSLISSIRINSSLDFCGEKVPLNSQHVLERLEKELLLILWDRAQVILWLKRAGRYMPLIEKALKQNNMPDDLKYISIVESALRPHVGSSKGAIGFWQFMKNTGRKYGLVINRNIDQRRNIHFSTIAAIKYLKKLQGDFESWTLAAAAYNMGERRLKTEIKSQNTKDFYHLYIPLETQRYILRIISVKMILSNPQKYGFLITKKDMYHPIQTKRTEITFKTRLHVSVIAESAGTYFKTIKDLNPEIRGHYLPAGIHSIFIPKESAGEFSNRFKIVLSRYTKDKNHFIYVVKKGESLSIIAEKFKVSLSALAAWNRLELKKHIHPGDRLIIYQGS
jgi:membrane-bound lytic murein transglycosylase D